MSEKIPVALVLSGGGALGAAHIGVVKQLQEKYHFEYLIGTSAGAIISAALACEIVPDDIAEYLKLKSLISLAFDFSIRGSGIIKGQKILDLLRKAFDDRTFEDLPANIKLRIFATNFNTGEGVVLKRGSIADAVRASLSIPGLFAPHWIDNVPYIDGGIVSNLPLEPVLYEYEGDLIFAVDVCGSNLNKQVFDDRNYISLKKSLERSLRIIFHQQISRLKTDPRVQLITPDLNSFGSADILKLKQIEEIGFLTAINSNSS